MCKLLTNFDYIRFSFVFSIIKPNMRVVFSFLSTFRKPKINLRYFSSPSILRPCPWKPTIIKSIRTCLDNTQKKNSSENILLNCFFNQLSVMS